MVVVMMVVVVVVILRELQKHLRPLRPGRVVSLKRDNRVRDRRKQIRVGLRGGHGCHRGIRNWCSADRIGRQEHSRAAHQERYSLVHGAVSKCGGSSPQRRPNAYRSKRFATTQSRACFMNVCSERGQLFDKPQALNTP